MRYPWIQVSERAFTVADQLGRMTGTDPDAALGKLCRLWAWATSLGPADKPPEGLVLGPLAAELVAATMGMDTEPQRLVSLLEALGVVERRSDGLRVKGMDRYRKTHTNASVRSHAARIAAQARWGKNGQGIPDSDASEMRHACVEDAPACVADAQPVRQDAKKEKERERTTSLPTEESASAAPQAPGDQEGLFDSQPPRQATPSAEVLQELWNSHPGLPRWREMPAGRRKSALVRLREREVEGPGGWREAVERIASSAFCRGENDRGWRADPDWLLRPGTAAKVLEGKYDGKAPGAQQRPKDVKRGWSDAADSRATHATAPVGVMKDF